jgi:hypothetical protein
MNDHRRIACTLIAALVVLLSAPALHGQQAEAKRPSLSLRVTPPIGFTPLRVRVVAEVRDGSDDYEDFYCAGVEWDWGDGTVSESASDCEPYEAGKSTIRRMFSADHVYRQAGQFRVVFKLKQKTRQVGTVSSNIQVRSSGGEFDR